MCFTKKTTLLAFKRDTAWFSKGGSARFGPARFGFKWVGSAGSARFGFTRFGRTLVCSPQA